MSLQAPMSQIPHRNANGGGGSGHKRTISAPSKLELMQMTFQARMEKEKQSKLAKEKEERMLNLYNQEQERQNKQINKYGYNNRGTNLNNNAARGPNVGGVRDYFQSRKETSGKGVRGKPPLPHQKNSAGRDRGNPLAPIDGGVLGHGGSPVGIRNSPKPYRANRKNYAVKGPYGTPNDSGNESSGYEDQNHNYKKVPQKVKRPPRMYQASSEEDVTTPARKQSSFEQWKQDRGKGGNNSNRTIPRSTSLHNGYHSDSGPGNTKQSDFQKFQGEMDKQRQDRLERFHQNRTDSNRESPVEDPPSHRSRGPPSNRQPPSTRRKQPPPRYEDSAEEDEDEAQYSNRSKVSNISSAAKNRHTELEAELKRKERDLLAMIQKQQDELQSMKTQRAQEEAEYDQEEDQEWLTGFVKDQKRQVKKKEREREEQEKKTREDALERKRKARAAEERARQASRHSNVEEPKHMPSPPPADMPKPFASRKPRRVKPPPPKKQPPAPPQQPEEPSFYDHSNAADFYAGAAMQDPDAAPVQLNLTPCGMCGRKFASDRIAKHQVACQKAQTAATKRKVFDPKKMRTEGTEMAQYAQNPRPEPKKKRTGDWRKKHEDFINTIRYAKKITDIENSGGNLADLPPPPRTENAHYKQCPYCERRFAPETAERHIPKCKDTRARPKPVNTGIKRRGR